MKIGVVGKPSSGKSTFFSASTLVDVPRAAYPFTTIKPNIGITYATSECAEKSFHVCCNPNNSKCEEGTRLIPITIIDVAGLVPDAHLGKGMGNQFLADLMDAEGLIHVVDMSGTTNEKGEATENHEPEFDIQFLQDEIELWMQGLLDENWRNIEKKTKQGKTLDEAIYEQLSGLGISQASIKEIVKKGYDDTADLTKKIRAENKPIILAGNKIDLKSSHANYEKLKDSGIIPMSAESEFALRQAHKAGLIHYVPGSKSFESLKTLNPSQEKALQFIQTSVLDIYGSTGVQKVINELVFNRLDYIPAYPVEDETKLTNAQGQVLPDVHLLKKGKTALDLAYKVHSQIGDKFLGAIDCRTKRKVGKEHVIQANDVIKILTRN